MPGIKYSFAEFGADIEQARNKIRAGGYPQSVGNKNKPLEKFLEQDKLYPSFNLRAMYAQGAHETAKYFSNFWVQSNNPVGMRAPNSRKINAGTRNCGVAGCFATYNNRVDGWADYLLRQAQFGVQLGAPTREYMESTISSGFDAGAPAAYSKAWVNMYNSIWGSGAPDVQTWKNQPDTINILSDEQEQKIKDAVTGGLKITGITLLVVLAFVFYKIIK